MNIIRRLKNIWKLGEVEMSPETKKFIDEHRHKIYEEVIGKQKRMAKILEDEIIIFEDQYVETDK